MGLLRDFDKRKPRPHTRCCVSLPQCIPRPCSDVDCPGYCTPHPCSGVDADPDKLEAQLTSLSDEADQFKQTVGTWGSGWAPSGKGSRQGIEPLKALEEALKALANK